MQGEIVGYYTSYTGVMGRGGGAQLTDPLDTFRKAGVQNSLENSRPTA